MCSLPPSAKKLLIAIETIIENHKQSKCRIKEPSPKSYIYKTIPAIKALGTLWKRRKNCTNQSISEFDVSLYPLVVSEATPTKSHQYNCPNMS